MLAALKQVADDIEAAGTNTRSTMAKELFASITSTMSDRAATCVRQNTLLQMYREEILPIVRQSRPEEMGEEDVEALLKMNHFFADYTPWCIWLRMQCRRARRRKKLSSAKRESQA